MFHTIFTIVFSFRSPGVIKSLLAVIYFSSPAFSIATVILDGFHISSYFENGTSDKCRSHIFLVVYSLHIVFVFVQTFFIFKNHRVRGR